MAVLRICLGSPDLSPITALSKTILRLLGNIIIYSARIMRQFVVIVFADLVMVAAGVVVVPVPTLTTLGAVWSKLGN